MEKTICGRVKYLSELQVDPEHKSSNPKHETFSLKWFYYQYIHYVHEVEGGTYKYRWGCWLTTDCYSGRKWFFHRWAQIRTDIQSVARHRWRNPLPRGSRTKGCQGHRSSPCQFLFLFFFKSNEASTCESMNSVSFNEADDEDKPL